MSKELMTHEELCTLVEAMVLVLVAWETPEQKNLMWVARGKLDARAKEMWRQHEITVLEKKLIALKEVVEWNK